MPMLETVAAIIVVATFYFIIRGAEVRLALLAGGAALALASMRPEAWFDSFAKSMAQAGLITVILPAIGFTAVIKLARCDQHLVRLVVTPLIRLRPVLIPVSMLATAMLSSAITSAAGITAAVGVVLIPAMIAVGIHPAMAAAAVFAGTWGAVWSPGSPHPAVISQIANVPVIEVIVAHLPGSIAAALTVAASLYVIARLRGEDKGWTPEGLAGSSISQAAPSVQTPASALKAQELARKEHSQEPVGALQPQMARPGTAPISPLISQEPVAALQAQMPEPVSIARALMPMLPLALLFLTVPQFGLTARWLPRGLTVLEAMIAGTVLTMMIARLSPAAVVKSFFGGMGESYGSVMGIIIAAGVFIGGLAATGAIDALVGALKSVRSAAPVFAMFGTFAIAALSGSGDAAALAFNQAVTPHAAELGMTPVNLGNLAWIGSGLGRSMSPVAAATAIAAGFAGVSVMELAKRNAIPMVLGAAVALTVLAFL